MQNRSEMEIILLSLGHSNYSSFRSAINKAINIGIIYMKMMRFCFLTIGLLRGDVIIMRLPINKLSGRLNN